MQMELSFPFRYGIISISVWDRQKISGKLPSEERMSAPMTFEFQRLSQDNALVIADEWKYGGVYSFYVRFVP